MAVIDKVCRSLLASVLIVVVASCGESAGPTAAYRQATAADPTPPKGGDPVSALPSHVVSGDVAAFKATDAASGMHLPKSLGAAGVLPSSLSAGKSAVYVAPAPGLP